MNPGGTNGDGYVSFSLGEGCWIGLVADAPSAAQPGSAGVLINAVDSYLESRGKATLGKEVDAGLGDRILVDIMMVANQRMVDESDHCWAAVVFVLVGNRKVYLGGVGDCAAYVGLDSGLCFRFSDTTRAGGSSILPRDGDVPEVRHLREGVYMGESTIASQTSDLETFERESVNRLLLLSDGLEEMVGISRIRDLLVPCEGVSFEKGTIANWIGKRELLDDITFLGVELDPPETTSQDELRETGAESNSIVKEGETDSVQVEDSVSRMSLLRKVFGFLLTVAGIALLGFVAWKFAMIYLEESGAFDREIEPNPIVEQEKIENPGSGPGVEGETESREPTVEENLPTEPEN